MPNDTPTKTCKTCGETKPCSEYYARRASCKACVRAEARAYHYRNREAQNRKSAEYWARNRDQLLQKQREYYRANREKADAAGYAWRLANPEKYVEYRRRSYQKHKARRIAEIREWRAANPEKVLEINRTIASRRRALEAAAPSVPFTLEQLEQRMAYFGGKCWICRTAPGNELDHVKPLTKGGSHMLSNLRPACRSCNSRKRNKWPFAPSMLVDEGA